VRLTAAEQEAAETQVWMETARDCDYINDVEFEEVFREIEHVLGQLVLMEAHPDKWVLKSQR